MGQYTVLLISGVVFSALCGLILWRREKGMIVLPDRPELRKWALAVFFVILAALAVSDFFIKKHDHINLGNIPMFYAVYGCLACVVLLVLARILRLLVKRDRDYYEKNNR